MGRLADGAWGGWRRAQRTARGLPWRSPGPPASTCRPPACLPSRCCAGQQWKEVKHDKSVTWLAFWRDPVNTKEYK